LIGVNQPSHDDFRANMRGGMSLRCWLNKEMPSDFPHAWVREALGQYSQVREYYYGDFYPLTDYSLWESDWLAYQMHRPDLGEGMVLAFRRVWCDDMIKAFKLRGLDESAQYVVKNLDSGVEVQLGGGKLMTEGLDVTIEERPSTGLLTYSKV
jgi:alpha-galactosidase